MKAELPVRGCDSKGCGHWGAPRGSREHRGIDYACEAGTVILPNITGQVTKIGYTYSDDLSFRYVQVTDQLGFDHRYFYLNPFVNMGDIVKKDTTPLGSVQTLKLRYEGITDHCHYEIKKDGSYFNPEEFNFV